MNVIRLGSARLGVSLTDSQRSGRVSTRWSDADVGEHLSGLASDPESVELVASLVNGSRASFTVAEAAALLSVSSKHLYAIISATGQVAPGVEVIRSGDRKMIPAHHLRGFLRLPDPHLPDRVDRSSEVLLDDLSPSLLEAVADSLAFLLMRRLNAAGFIDLPDEAGDSL